MIPTFHVGGFGWQGARWDTDDPYWSSVILLLRMEGADTGTSFSDSGPLNISLDVTSGYSTSVTQVKFGSTSCKCTGAGGRFRYLNTSGTELTGDFTAEAFVYWDDTPITDSYALGIKPSNSSGIMRQPGAGTPHALAFYNGSYHAGSTAITNDVWHHICLQRSGSTIEYALDGVSQGSVSDSGTYCGNGTYTYIAGAQDGGGQLGFPSGKDYIDAVRITKGVARYTFPFTPPASEY
jgi:hypothetical protein